MEQNRANSGWAEKNSGEKSRAYLHHGTLYKLRQGDTVFLERWGKCRRLNTGELATSLFKQELDSRCIHSEVWNSFPDEFKEESLPQRVVAGVTM